MSYKDLKIEDKMFVSFAAFMDLLGLCLKEPHLFSNLRDFQYVSTFTSGGFAGEQHEDFYNLVLFRTNGYPSLKVSIFLDSTEYLDVSFWTFKRGVSDEETNILISQSEIGSFGDWDEGKLLTFLRAYERIESEFLLLSFGVGLGYTSSFVKLAKALGLDRDTIVREGETIAHHLTKYNKKFLEAIGKK